MPQSTDLREQILEFTVGKRSSVSLGSGSTRTLVAYTALPGIDGTGGTAATQSNGDRAEVDIESNFTASIVSSSSISNSTDITFPVADDDWGTIVGVGLWRDTVLLRLYTAATPITINDGDTLVIPSGNLSLGTT